MPVNLSIKNAPDDVVERLRQRAKKNHRSLQGELLAIVADATASRKQALTIEELAAEVDKLGFQTPSEAVEMIREDRDGR